MKILLKKIYSFLVKLIFDSVYGKLKIADKSFFKENIKILRIKLFSFSHKEYQIFLTNKTRVYSDKSENLAYIKDNYLLPEISLQLSKNYLISIENNSVLKTGTKKLVQKKFSGNILSLVQGVSAIDNYGHWMLDILPKLCISEKILNLNEFDGIYLPNIKRRFQIDSLKYFNINPKKYIDGSELNHIFAEKLTIPQHPYWETNAYQMDTVANIDPDIINILRTKFLKNIKNLNKEKLFIDRSDSKYFHSQIENMEELYEFLKKNKFEILKLSQITFEEQISLFQNAKIVVGAHGAGLCNLIFCDPKTKVIEFSNKEFKCDVFKNICKINNLDYYKLISENEVPKDRINPDIKLSINKLSKLI